MTILSIPDGPGVPLHQYSIASFLEKSVRPLATTSFVLNKHLKQQEVEGLKSGGLPICSRVSDLIPSAATIRS
ncbi:hypothetical protein OGATHE_002263 [Ogataea polymorpha]|uniref:Uncharacterized protein n=1 Tax=Ogataea polymorpha TaxID=460523 RepID=A0A9P8TAP0_9ASCO|nr:hypothetical protein OGATHE_002263 [Ogataea polymorpha]